ncbi:hypothetical protein ACP70R_046991 [Stipagrostis hirtigluma subsp. patula]
MTRRRIHDARCQGEDGTRRQRGVVTLDEKDASAAHHTVGGRQHGVARAGEDATARRGMGRRGRDGARRIQASLVREDAEAARHEPQ